MRNAQLFHNPGAGGGEHDIEEVKSAIEANGFNCHYTSVKENNWKNIKDGADFLIIAGGDGTVKKVCKMILKHNVHLPVALLPLGTANNVASSLKLKDKSLGSIIKGWHKNKQIKYDTGKLTYGGNENFFFESFGYGIFPFLITKMIEKKPAGDITPEQSKLLTLEELQQIIPLYSSADCKIKADGKDHSGRYFMAEIMLTHSIGPNLLLTPHSNLDDGVFDLVLLGDADKKKLSSFVSSRINNKTDKSNFSFVNTKEVVVSWAGSDVHIDDEVISMAPGTEVKVQIMPSALQFLVM